jgi:hypothetical protein
MSAYAYLLDLLRQVANVLQPSHGGTGHSHGSEWVLARGINSTGATIGRRNIVQLTGATNAAKVSKVTATDSTHVLGVCIGYWDGDGELVIDDCPDGYEMAIQIGGIAECLIETAVTRDEFAYAAATDGQIYSQSAAGTGAFGRIVDSQDTSTGATYCKVVLGLPGSGAGGGAATFGTPALTLSTTNAAGSASTGIRTDATVAAFDATVPVTQAFSDSAAAGSAGVAARRDHKHGMPANPAPSFATPAIVLGSAAAAGSAGTVIRSDGTIAAFDTTAPTTQAPSDAATVGTAAFAARRDHKHGWPAFGTGSSDIAQGNHTHGAGGGGTWDTVVVKAADESVASSTALQNDDELLFAATNAAVYQFEAWLIVDGQGAGGTASFKFSFGEDNTFRGYLMRVAGNSGTGVAEVTPGSVQQNQPLSARTQNGNLAVYVVGSWVSAGGTFRLQWAQQVSNGTAVIVRAGSTLKIKRLV